MLPHRESSPLGSRGCPTIRKIRRIFIVMAPGGLAGGYAYKWSCVFDFVDPTFKNILFFRCLQLSDNFIFIFFGAKKAILELVDRKLTQKSTLLAKLRPVLYGHFGGEKNRFLDFFKVILELFRNCLGTVFGLKRSTLGGIFSSKG